MSTRLVSVCEIVVAEIESQYKGVQQLIKCVLFIIVAIEILEISCLYSLR